MQGEGDLGVLEEGGFSVSWVYGHLASMNGPARLQGGASLSGIVVSSTPTWKKGVEA